ncbi:MAG TPA: hypothetical protein VNU68_09905 [Verrucomicrobiae bacterium]|nr:hypothetical protein [Verrucomicrobiae bacterium]
MNAHRSAQSLTRRGALKQFARGLARLILAATVCCLPSARATAAQQAYVKASNTGGPLPGIFSGDFFGLTVAVSGDTMVIGAPDESSNATGVNGDQNDNSAYASGARTEIQSDQTPSKKQ